MEKTAILLCAGKGQRLAPLTKDTPKPLLKIGELTLVEHLILHLKKYGYSRIGINLHYRAEDFYDKLGDGSHLGVKIFYHFEPKLTGTAGAIKGFEEIITQNDFLVVYGDLFTNYDLSNLERLHIDNLATIAIHNNPKSNSFVYTKNDIVTQFIERPTTPPEGNNFMANSGIYLLNKKIIDIVDQIKLEEIDFPRDIFPKLVNSNQLKAVNLTGYRFAIDSIERLDQAKLYYGVH